MRNGIILVLSIAILTGCSERRQANSTLSKNTVIRDLKLSTYNEGQKAWDLKCITAEVNEREKKINCFSPEIFLIKGSSVSAEIYGQEGIIDLNTNKSFIKNRVKIYSHEQELKLFTEKLYFDSGKNLLWSDSRVKVLTDRTETVAAGFTARPDLSNIKFYKHETKKI